MGIGNIVGEYDGAGDLVAHYDHGAASVGLVSRTDPTGTPAFYTDDALGNIRELASSAGEVMNSYAYLPFGGPLRNSESLVNSFKFVGQFGVTDEANGLDFMGARFYSPALGRFLSPDPLRLVQGAGADYEYVGNNPVGSIDPVGKLGCDTVVTWMLKQAGKQVAKKVAGKAAGYFGNEMVTHSEEKKGIRLDIEYWQRLRYADEIEQHVQETEAEWDAAHAAAPWESQPTCPDGGDGSGPSSPGDPGGPGGSGGAGMGGPDGPEAPNGPEAPGGAGGSGSTPVTRPTDPNRLLGPAGYGPGNLLSSGSTLAYRIDFENMTNASAPAQQVIITDQLSTNYDWATFNVSEIGFGDRLIALPIGTHHFETNVPFTYLGTNFQVQRGQPQQRDACRHRFGLGAVWPGFVRYR